jgi:ribonucleoside-diphosphate reductase alpha subunit
MSYVTKRNGKKEPVSFDKITERIARLINPPELKSFNISEINSENDYLDAVIVAQKVIANLYSGITTQELDLQSAAICQNMSTIHPSYSKLGGRIISNLHKSTMNTFSEKVALLGKETEIMHPKFVNYVSNNKEKLDKLIDYNCDYFYEYFGFKTLEKSSLFKVGKNIVERPQDMLMRVAVSLHINYNTGDADFDSIKKTYELISMGYYTHASPTMYNAGTITMQMSSCFLGDIYDSLKSLRDTWGRCAEISKWAGGIGLSASKIRSKDSIIKGTRGTSGGIVPQLKIFDQIARGINQGGKRPGSIAIYLEPHHADIFDFLDLRKNFGDDTQRARDLFLALWVCDLFMKQVEIDGDWYLMCPSVCTGLTEVFGDEYEKLYWEYVNAGKYKTKISARKLWIAILDSQIETGMPYIAFKDSVNKKSNQKNLGTIKNSNLCIEITEYSDDKEYAVCNLASISLRHLVKPFVNDKENKWIVYTKPNCKYCEYTKKYLTYHKYGFTEIQYCEQNTTKLKNILQRDTITFPQIFLNTETKNNHIGGWSNLYEYTASTYDYDKLYNVAYVATINLNKVIDINYYPVPETKLSNMKHRPIGLGIQGLADTLALMRIPFDSNKAVELNARIMETIYLASVTASNNIAKERNEDFKKWRNFIEKYKIELKVPEFYDDSFQILTNNCLIEKYNMFIESNPNSENNSQQIIDELNKINELYHKLKPNIHELTKLSGDLSGAYSSFVGSYFSEGKFQFDLWNVKPTMTEKWNKLKESVVKYGTRNSLLTALMPTASTSQILGNNECFEYFTNNIYTRNTQAGDFVMTNKYMVNDMLSVGMWNTEIKDKIIACNGSIQTLDTLPPQFRELYKTMWEIRQVWVLEAALARSPYVDQTQSMNLFLAKPDHQRLGSSHMWAWKNGLKTGQYYLRTKPASDAIKFTIDPKLIKEITEKKNDDSGCENCSA